MRINYTNGTDGNMHSVETDHHFITTSDIRTVLRARNVLDPNGHFDIRAVAHNVDGPTVYVTIREAANV